MLLGGVLSGCCLEGVEWMLLDVVLSGCCLEGVEWMLLGGC